MVWFRYDTLLSDARAVDVAREAVCKHRIVFVASAGNNGPGLTTSGAPGGTTPDILSVGAYAYVTRRHTTGSRYLGTSSLDFNMHY